MDIYFIKEWGIVNQYIENGEVKLFELKTENGSIKNMFILRKIPQLILGKQYYDIITPYGYGGPYIEEYIEGKKEDLLKEYEEQFLKYCEENNIVSEFIRFHPIIQNVKDFEKIYDVEYMRHTVGTSLKGENPVEEEFAKSCKKYINRAIKKGVTYEIIVNPDSLNEFIEVYLSTMDRKYAKEFYYFPKEYFENCIKLFSKNIVLVKVKFNGEIIAAGFYLKYGTTLHAHLSGTKSEFLELSPAYIIKYAMTIWGKENGYTLIHHGGGTSNSIEDSLYQFKLKFTKGTIFDFYIGKKIWNREIYEKLVEKKENKSFFPAYRE